MGKNFNLKLMKCICLEQTQKQEKLSVLLNGFNFQDPEFKPTYQDKIYEALNKSPTELRVQGNNEYTELRDYYNNLGNLYLFDKEESRIIKEKLRILGLKYKESEPDGACLFHSLLACKEYKSKKLPAHNENLKYPNNEILELKNKLYEHLFKVIDNENDKRRSKYLLAIGAELKEDLLNKNRDEQIMYILRYIMYMEEPRSWGGDTEIALYCNLNQIQVNIYLRKI